MGACFGDLFMRYDDTEGACRLVIAESAHMNFQLKARVDRSDAQTI
jgi:hypothetical protein